MAQGVEEVVCHHFGFAAGATGEIHEHGVGVGVDMLWPDKRRCLADFGMPVVKALWHRGPNAHKHFDGGALGHGGLYLTQDIVLAHADDGFDRSSCVAVDDVVLGEHVCGWYGHSPEFAECQHGDPPLKTSFLDEHHHVSMADAERLQIGCRQVTACFEVAE